MPTRNVDKQAAEKAIVEETYNWRKVEGVDSES